MAAVLVKSQGTLLQSRKGETDVVDSHGRFKQLGGAVQVPPTDVPDISRFSIVADPQMATLALIKGRKPGGERPAELDKRRQADVRDFLLAESDFVIECGVPRRRHIRRLGRHC
jgi:hypothetical protein